MGTNKTRKIIHYFPSSDKLLLNWNGLQLIALLFLLPQPRVSQGPRINPLMKGKRMSQVSFLPSNVTDEWYKYTMSWVIRMLCHHSSMGQHTKGFQFSDNRDGHHIPSRQSPPKEQSRDSEKPLFLSPSLLSSPSFWPDEAPRPILLCIVPQANTYATPYAFTNLLFSADLRQSNSDWVGGSLAGC